MDDHEVHEQTGRDDCRGFLINFYVRETCRGQFGWRLAKIALPCQKMLQTPRSVRSRVSRPRAETTGPFILCRAHHSVGRATTHSLQRRGRAHARQRCPP